jgi:hypothetical protein
MYSTLTTLIDLLDTKGLAEANVIEWSSPVLSFGDLSQSRVATIGLNPSNREFVDVTGNELEGNLRRFHTLRSLGLKSWSEADSRHLDLIMESCNRYFNGNPYDRWFKKLDQLIFGTQTSYYNTICGAGACHLDLIPYATTCKWAQLTSQQCNLLLSLAGNTLGRLLRDSSVQLVILNGQTVVEQFQRIAGVSLKSEMRMSWALPRQTAQDVVGVAYRGEIESLSDIILERKILVLGYNHNLQSSFGVTKEVTCAIRDWITQNAEGVIR